MRYSGIFPKTKREAPKDAVSVNHKLLVRAGFIDQLMAGSWTILPLGWRVIVKINQIIREEINAIGGLEMLMPLMHPKEIWNETGRWESAAEVMYQLKDSREREFALSFTHEEIVMSLVRKHVTSYRDLPLAVYHFSTKFRNEPRATGGILRGREFLMKDLYSMHASEEDLMRFYEEAKAAYRKIFERLGLKTRVTEADGGVFTQNRTHEFQVLSEAGEDTIYFCDACDWGQNKEIFKGSETTKCPACKRGNIESSKSIEVGNIFPLGIEKYALKMGVNFTDEAGEKKPVWFGSYGIGPSRIMGTIVEVSHDDKGIIWPASVAPFDVHLVEIDSKNSAIKEKVNDVYRRLTEAGMEVLWDDTDRGAGEKFADCDLIGIPLRLVVSSKTLEKGEGMVELKGRNQAETLFVGIEEVIRMEREKKL